MPARRFVGVKNRHAMEFTGFQGTKDRFLHAYRRGKPTAPRQQHQYTAAEIREIRLHLAGQADPPIRPRKLPPVINVRMPKGGVGKTTITANVASCMALMGYRVLMIDGDPQANLSIIFGVNWANQHITHIGDLMQRCQNKQPTKIEEAIIPVYAGGMLDLIPASINLSAADLWLTGAMNREHAFSRLIEHDIDFFSRYDAILIDSAPGTTLLTLSFMVASQRMLTVVAPEAQAIESLPLLESNLQDLNNNFPGRNYQTRIVVNRLNQAKGPHIEAFQKLAEQYGDILEDTMVRDYVGFLRQLGGEDHEHGPLIELDPGSAGARDIIELTKSVIHHYGVKLNGVPATAKEVA